MKKYLHTNCSQQGQAIRSIWNSTSINGIQKLFILILITMVNMEGARALPSFARQTGMACTACHFSFPELTSFGRQFKVSGYTLTTMPAIEAQVDSNRMYRLKLLQALPIAVMVQSSFTHIAKDVEGTQNNSVAFPQQLSVFYAGEVTPHIGAFIQMTYDGHVFGMDNADIRYTNVASLGTKSLIYGLTLNNNPAVQDVWNTSPAWRFPSASSDAARNPAKSTLMENLGSQVAGLGGYALFNDLLFAELTFYKSAQQGASNPADTTSTMVINGVAPYWRLALQHQWTDYYMEIGTFGIASEQFLGGISGPKDKFTDLGFDLQFEKIFPAGAFTVHTSLISEKETRDISLTDKMKLNFNSFKIDANLYLKNGLGATVGYFSTSGTADDAVGSFNNQPNSNGLIFQLEYLPWYNTKFSVQYVSYNKFDGSRNNYDAMGRNAPNNNTLYLLAWLNF